MNTTMNTTKLEISKKLYEVSGWERTYFSTYKGTSNSPLVKTERDRLSGENLYQVTPTYDLSYLLMKLPGHITLKSITWDDIHIKRNKNSPKLDYQAVACYQSNIRHLLVREVGNTPEDAAALLAIELFKQGILTKESN